MDLVTTPVTQLHGVGPALAERLAGLGIGTVQDLLFHLPFRYEDRTRIQPMGSVRPGDRAVVQGTIDIAQIKFGRRRSLLCRISDGTGAILLRFFHFSQQQQAQLERGLTIRCFGEIRHGATGPEMVHPEYRLLRAGEEFATEELLTPVYASSEGLRQASLRRLTTTALALLARHPLPELMPAPSTAGGWDLNSALTYLHQPPPEADLTTLEQGRHPAQQRLAMEELVAHQLSVRALRRRVRAEAAPVLAPPGVRSQSLVAGLPFTLTAAQQRVLVEMQRDLARGEPMMRLVQGDVGSGKTIVAALALLQAVESGHQAALMAPTEMLAEQHWQNLRTWLEPLEIELIWLSGRLRAAERRTALARIERGEADIAVGTHALFQEEVRFARLALAVIDEQHRFGVHQRLALIRKGGEFKPHQLVMTATPIPRTLAMAAYADLDCSVIDELPPGRQPIETIVLSESRRAEVIARVSAACAAGQQAYWVCPLIEESEKLQCQAAEESAKLLAETLPELAVGLVHGRMASDERDTVMRRFKAGEIQLLVATTVIEVGVDVPNASLMIIENAERLGLAQLHQLRGRVGRGSRKSHCLLLYRPPLGGDAKTRLAVMREYQDGFAIARHDLAIRGPGELLGARQSGQLQFRVADLVRDQDLVEPAQRLADRILDEYPRSIEPLIRRWLGRTEEYAEA